MGCMWWWGGGGVGGLGCMGVGESEEWGICGTVIACQTNPSLAIPLSQYVIWEGDYILTQGSLYNPTLRLSDYQEILSIVFYGGCTS